MSISHLFHSSDAFIQQTEGGKRIVANKSNFPILQGMSFYRLILNPHAVREPHWHANADELGYCLQGQILISIYDTNNVKKTFMVNQGEAFLIPSGALHSIENASNEISDLILQFSHEQPEDFAISSTLSLFTDAVLGNTWNKNSAYFKQLTRVTQETLITLRKGTLTYSQDVFYDSPNRFKLDATPPLIKTEGGSAKLARKSVWPALRNQAIYSLKLTGQGMREPHWHPETAELGFVHKGKGRMSILSPDGSIDTYEMNEGDIYFIPKAYPHHIENLTTNPLHLLIFFDQVMPGDIGFTASLKAFSNEILASSLNSSEAFFENLPLYYEDLFIVDKLNPLD